MALASLWAATIRSSRISASSGLSSERSIFTPHHVALAVQRHRHQPAAGAALDSSALISACISAMRPCSSCACFIMLRKILHQLVPSSWNSGSSASCGLGAACARLPSAAHRRDARVGEVLQDLLHLRMLANALDLAGLARAALRTERCGSLLSALTATIQTRPVQAFSFRISSWPSSCGAAGSGLISRCPGRKRTRRSCSRSACLSFRSRFASASATRSSKLCGLRGRHVARRLRPRLGANAGMAGGGCARARTGSRSRGAAPAGALLRFAASTAPLYRRGGASDRTASADRRRKQSGPAPYRRRRAAVARLAPRHSPSAASARRGRAPAWTAARRARRRASARPRSRRIGRRFSGGLDPGDGVHGIRKIGDHLRRLGAVVD